MVYVSPCETLAVTDILDPEVSSCPVFPPSSCPPRLCFLTRRSVFSEFDINEIARAVSSSHAASSCDLHCACLPQQPFASLAEHSPGSPSVWTTGACGAGAWPALTPLGLLFSQRLQSGTTGVCALIAGKTLHVAWLGDSQVILVQQGQVVKLMEPHRPERQVRAPSTHTWDIPGPTGWAHQGSRWSGSPGRELLRQIRK